MSAWYLAARYSRKPELQDYARDLTARGHSTSSTWLLPEIQRGEPANARIVEQPGGIDTHPDLAAPYAIADLDDVDRCDVLCLFTEPEPIGRGGAQVEFGYALGLGAATGGPQLVVCGPRINVFHALPGIEWVTDWPTMLALLDQDLLEVAS